MKKVCIIGVGLIGASFAKAIIATKQAEKIIGFDKNIKNLKIAKDMNIIHDYTDNIKDAIYMADLILIATPASSFKDIFKDIKPHLHKFSIITDVCSIKGSVIKDIELIFGEVPENFIPTHPIAGKEKSGVMASDGNLFTNKKIIITPVVSTSNKLLSKVEKIWLNIGASIEIMNFNTHDKLLSLTSHLPHMLAFSIVNYIISQNNKAMDYAAGGFADFSRIASSDALMWRDICIGNKDLIANNIKGYIETLNNLLYLIENNEIEQIENFFLQAKVNRDNWLKEK